jgi:hypothetical protein
MKPGQIGLSVAAIAIISLLVSLQVNCSDSTRDGGNSQAIVAVANCPKLGLKMDSINISILVDLSDRIDTLKYPNPAMQYYRRDIGYITSITEAFECHLLNKKINLMNDHVSLYFDPPPANSEINSLAAELRFSFSKANATSDLISSVSSTYKANCSKIYKLAMSDRNYVGSDIWGFFSDRVADYCIKPGARNILVIMTDGYIYHADNLRRQGGQYTYITPGLIRKVGLSNSDWQEKLTASGFGLLPAIQGLNNLEVIVLNINSSESNRNDKELLELVWSNWMQQMGVSRFQFVHSDLPANLDQFLKGIVWE